MKRGENSGVDAKSGYGERIVLSERDSVRVLKLLEHPPKPTPALLAAARRRARRALR